MKQPIEELPIETRLQIMESVLDQVLAHLNLKANIDLLNVKIVPKGDDFKPDFPI